MKAACVLFFTMSCAALMHGASHEATPQATSATENQSLNRARLAGVIRPKQLQSDRKRSIPGNLANLHQLRAEDSSATKSKLFQNKLVSNIQRARPNSAAQPGQAALYPRLNNVRHNNPAPAFVGGSANSERRSTGAVDGTRMHHKP